MAGLTEESGPGDESRPSDEPGPRDESGPSGYSDRATRAFRIDVSAAMGIDAGPWTVDSAAAPGDPPIRWLGSGRATLRLGPDDGAGEDLPVVVGSPERRSRSGRTRREIVVGGWRIVLDVEPERMARLRERASRGRADAGHAGPLELRAIIPGRIVDVFVAEGDRIEAGHHLMVLEAMKMQNELRSPRGGTVERIAVGEGQTVELGTLLVVIR